MADIDNSTFSLVLSTYAMDTIRRPTQKSWSAAPGAATLPPKSSAKRAQVAVIPPRFCQNITK